MLISTLSLQEKPSVFSVGKCSSCLLPNLTFELSMASIQAVREP